SAAAPDRGELEPALGARFPDGEALRPRSIARGGERIAGDGGGRPLAGPHAPRKPRNARPLSALAAGASGRTLCRASTAGGSTLHLLHARPSARPADLRSRAAVGVVRRPDAPHR